MGVELKDAPPKAKGVSKTDSQQLAAVKRQPLRDSKWLMPALDVGLAFVSFVLAWFARYELTIFREVLAIYRSDFGPYLPYALIYAALLFVSYSTAGLYKYSRSRALLEEITAIINGVTSATVILLALYFAFQPLVFSRLMLVYVAAITITLLGTVRVIRRVVQAYLRSKGLGVQRVLIVGAGDVGQAVLAVMMARKDLGYQPIGFVDDDPERGTVDLGRVKALGNFDNFKTTLRKHHVDLVVITLPWKFHDRILNLTRQARRAGAEVRIVPDVFQLNMRQVQVENLDGIPLLGVNGDTSFEGTKRIIKRVMDMTLIILALPVIITIFALVALAIRLEGPGPIFYKGRRVGENGEEFDIIKFRSMIPDAEKYRQQLVEESGEDPRHPKIKNDPRVTRVGHFLRSTSIDELPQLLNVVRGQMSLVGPRPPTPEEVTLYENWHMQRLQIIPGMTGLWQVSGRSDVPFDEMCLLDIYYIQNWSIKLDAQILAMTLPRVLLRHGAY